MPGTVSIAFEVLLLSDAAPTRVSSSETTNVLLFIDWSFPD